MKQLKDGGKAFYVKGMTIRLLIVWLGILAFLFCNLWEADFAFSEKIIWAFVGLLLWAAGFAYSMCIMRWRFPVCVVYPQKISARNKEIFWSNMAFYSLEQKRGKTLLLAGINKNRGESLELAFGALSGQDQKLLMKELIERGVPDQQTYLGNIQTEIKKLAEELDQISQAR